MVKKPNRQVRSTPKDLRESPIPNTPYRELRQAVERILVASAPKTLTFAEIRAILARQGLRFSPNKLELALTDYRAARPRSQRVTAPPQNPRPVLAVDLALGLYRPEVDAVELTHSEHRELQIRVDKVLDEARPFWLSAWLPAHSSILADHPWRTLRSWRLPLVAFNAGSWSTPGLGVLRLASVEEAASLAASLVPSITQDANLLPNLHTEECSPAEASRRTEVGVLILRKRQIARSRGFTQSSCLKCGLPLSDPTSVAIGLGPECRKHLPQLTVGDLQSRSPQRRFLIGARHAKQWVQIVSRKYQSQSRHREESDRNNALDPSSQKSICTDRPAP